MDGPQLSATHGSRHSVAATCDQSSARFAHRLALSRWVPLATSCLSVSLVVLRFDIMHSGHYNAIRQAKALTDILVVGVHSDEEIRKHKGPPVMNDPERLATVNACKWVDEIVFGTPYDPSLELLVKLNCD